MNIHPFSLDHPLLTLQSGSKDNKPETWTTRNAVEGVLIFGATGSGKSSGSAERIALKYLEAGFGGIILTVKPDERKTWENYCRQTGRSNDLIVLEPFGPHAFDFINYESLHRPGGISITENLVHVLRTVINAGNEKDAGGGSRDPFWDDALNTLLSNTLDLCQLAYGSITVQHIYDIVQSIPKGLNTKDEEGPFSAALKIAKDKINEQLDAWEKTLDPFVLNQYLDTNRYESEAEKVVRDMRTLKMVDEFFTRQFIPLADKTRSTVEFTCITFLNRLMREPIYSLFCGGKTTVTPEDCANGKIVLIDLPVKIFDKAGRDAQILMKFCFQRAFERRKVYDTTRMIFLFADEAQNFIHEHDALFQSTSRSSRVSTVYVTQNLPAYYANMGGKQGDERVKNFLGNFNTKFFHANADADTNKYASELIGDAYEEKLSVGQTKTLRDVTQSENISLELKRIFRPEGFMRLLTGGQSNNYIVEAILHRQGKPFATGRNAIKVRFRQKMSNDDFLRWAFGSDPAAGQRLLPPKSSHRDGSDNADRL
jgi:hypothetical protein